MNKNRNTATTGSFAQTSKKHLSRSIRRLFKLAQGLLVIENQPAGQQKLPIIYANIRV